MTRRSVLLRWVRRIWVTLGLLFLGWMFWNMQARGVSADQFASTGSLTVESSDEMTMFLPVAAGPNRAGLIFLPGGGVDWRAYGPFVRSIADWGFPAAIVRLPYRVAPTDASRAAVWQRIEAVGLAWGSSRPVVLSGHSRGAALSARFADEHRGQLDGLLLIATTHPRDQDLSHLAVPVVKIVAEHDCVASPAAARANARLLPPGTLWVEIAGGNHAQFGHYGSQLNDCGATIPREAQQAQARHAALELLVRISSRN
jgi:pimeloyl-ACP methyl ester carboxylesterase